MSSRSTNSLGHITSDLSLSNLNTHHIYSHVSKTANSVDPNVVEIEKDIHLLQQMACTVADESTDVTDQVQQLQNDVIDLQCIHTLPWFAKSNFGYEQISASQWDDGCVPDAATEMFVRTVTLTNTYTAAFVLLPRAANVGEARHVSFSPRANEAVVYVTTSPLDSCRLSAFDVEWVLGTTDSSAPSDVFVGQKALLSRPAQMEGWVFGATADSSTPHGRCVVFPDSGAFYVQSLYLDNQQDTSRITLVGQKFQPTSGKQLGGFVVVGLH